MKLIIPGKVKGESLVLENLEDIKLYSEIRDSFVSKEFTAELNSQYYQSVFEEFLNKKIMPKGKVDPNWTADKIMEKLKIKKKNWIMKSLNIFKKNK